MSETVLDEYHVDSDSKGVQLTKIDLFGESSTEQFVIDGTYKLVRVDE